MGGALVLETWLKKFLHTEKLPPPKEVPPDHQRRYRRLEAEKQTLESMRRLAINESDPQFLAYVINREAQLDSLIDAQLNEEFEVITEEQREKPGGRGKHGAHDT